jgi:hypothetical protein
MFECYQQESKELVDNLTSNILSECRSEKFNPDMLRLQDLSRVNTGVQRTLEQAEQKAMFERLFNEIATEEAELFQGPDITPVAWNKKRNKLKILHGIAPEQQEQAEKQKIEDNHKKNKADQAQDRALKAENKRLKKERAALEKALLEKQKAEELARQQHEAAQKAELDQKIKQEKEAAKRAQTEQKRIAKRAARLARKQEAILTAQKLEQEKQAMQEALAKKMVLQQKEEEEKKQKAILAENARKKAQEDALKQAAQQDLLEKKRKAELFYTAVNRELKIKNDALENVHYYVPTEHVAIAEYEKYERYFKTRYEKTFSAQDPLQAYIHDYYILNTRAEKLCDAARAGNYALLELWLRLSGNPNNYRGYLSAKHPHIDATPLEIAHAHGHKQCEELLIKHMAQINLGPNKHMFPAYKIYRAAERGEYGRLRPLVDRFGYEADLYKDSDQACALDIAIKELKKLKREPLPNAPLMQSYIDCINLLNKSSQFNTLRRK